MKIEKRIFLIKLLKLKDKLRYYYIKLKDRILLYREENLCQVLRRHRFHCPWNRVSTRWEAC